LTTFDLRGEIQMGNDESKSEPEDVRDLRTRRCGIDNFASFMKFLAPLARGPVDDGVRAGQQEFAALGCAVCQHL
jgi:hypothetical protein